MTNAFLKPSIIDGEIALVRDPETMVPLADEGEWKTISPFWTRRIRDAEVIDATASVNASPVKSAGTPREPIAKGD